jgi:hypothetical protein
MIRQYEIKIVVFYTRVEVCGERNKAAHLRE